MKLHLDTAFDIAKVKVAGTFWIHVHADIFGPTVDKTIVLVQ